MRTTMGEMRMNNEAREKAGQFRRMIEAADKICILGHIRPDGDCVGSTLGIYNYIMDNYPGKTADVYLEAFAAPFRFLNGSRKVKHELQGKHYDLAISLDVSDTQRLGKFQDLFLTAISTVCIDHHVSNPGFGDLCYIRPDASSTCEVISELIDMDRVSLNTANCLYTGIVHDTGVFKYSCTGRYTMDLAGLLLEKGVNGGYIIDETFYKKTYKQNLLMARTVLESRLYLDGRLIYGHVSRQMAKEFKAAATDMEGIVEQLRLTEGVEIAVFSYQLTRKGCKFSLRAKDEADVRVIAEALGGGGHIKAAGFESSESPEKTLKMVLELAEKQLR